MQLNLENDAQQWSGFVVGDPDGGSCNGNSYTTHKGKALKDVIVHYEISARINKGQADLRLRDNSVIIGTMARCQYLQRSCYTFMGHTFWNIVVPQSHCENAAIFAFYQGEVTKRIEVLENNDTKVTNSLVQMNHDHFSLRFTGTVEYAGWIAL